jgi:hypothetical protein
MGKFKDAQLNPYIYDTEQGLPTWTDPVFIGKAMALRNSHWHENMPDLTGKALADAQHEFDDMPLWIQLELDLWEGKNGINEWTAWDVEGGYVRG